MIIPNIVIYVVCDLFFRLFQVTLRQDAQSVFTDDVVFENSLGPINFKTDSVYSGFLEGNFSYCGTLRRNALKDKINKFQPAKLF